MKYFVKIWQITKENFMCLYIYCINSEYILYKDCSCVNVEWKKIIKEGDAQGGKKRKNF